MASLRQNINMFYSSRKININRTPITIYVGMMEENSHFSFSAMGMENGWRFSVKKAETVMGTIIFPK